MQRAGKTCGFYPRTQKRSLSQDGATPAVLASKAGHREIADLIAAGGSPAGRHALPTQAPARKHEDSTTYTYDQLRVGTLTQTVMCVTMTARMWCGGQPESESLSEAACSSGKLATSTLCTCASLLTRILQVPSPFASTTCLCCVLHRGAVLQHDDIPCPCNIDFDSVGLCPCAGWIQGPHKRQSHSPSHALCAGHA